MKPEDIDRRLKKLFRVDFARIEIGYTDHGVSVRAIPNNFHPLVGVRREAAIAAKEGSITLSEATAIQQDALAPVGKGYGKTLSAALDALEADLKGAKAA